MSMSGKQMMALEALLLEELIAERDSLRKRVKDLEKQPKQKPVAVFDEKFGRPKMLANAPILTHGQKFYTTPPRREWVGLTDDEREELMDTYDVASTDYARAIEAKLKEKNT